jgi:hypothetical protein
VTLHAEARDGLLAATAADLHEALGLGDQAPDGIGPGLVTAGRQE